MNQSELEANISNRRQGRENACEQITTGFDSNWLRKRHEFYQPIKERCNAKSKKERITFDNRVIMQKR